MKKILIAAILLIFTLGCAQDVKEEPPKTSTKDIQFQIELSRETASSPYFAYIKMVNVVDSSKGVDLSSATFKMNISNDSGKNADYNFTLVDQNVPNSYITVERVSIEALDRVNITMDVESDRYLTVTDTVPDNDKVKRVITDSAFHATSYIEIDSK